ncbi:MAG: FecR domain-containing protein [Gallionellaceae bacterium]
MKNSKLTAASVCIFLLANSTSVYAGIAGNVQFVNGKVFITNSAAQPTELKKGDAVLENDTVTTSKDSSAQLRMRDGGFIVVRPDTQLKVDRFEFGGKEDGNEKSFFSLIRGGIRAITGMIGQQNKSNYRIVTASSTIAIRGTDHETYVVTPGSSLSKQVPVGTYNKVNVGETAVINDHGLVAVLPNQMGFAGGADQIPQLQPVNLNIFTVSLAPPAKNGLNYGDVRASSVVDSSVLGLAAAAYNMVPQQKIQTPITGRSGGTTSPSIVF